MWVYPHTFPYCKWCKHRRPQNNAMIILFPNLRLHELNSYILSYWLLFTHEITQTLTDLPFCIPYSLSVCWPYIWKVTDVILFHILISGTGNLLLGLSSVRQLLAECTVIQGVTIVRGKTVDHRTSNYFRAVATSMVGPHQNCFLHTVRGTTVKLVGSFVFSCQASGLMQRWLQIGWKHLFLFFLASPVIPTILHSPSEFWGSPVLWQHALCFHIKGSIERTPR